eukprot:68473-Pleurochrysis_carterae.AAC.5
MSYTRTNTYGASRGQSFWGAPPPHRRGAMAALRAPRSRALGPPLLLGFAEPRCHDLHTSRLG